jgi:hypothetical protein
MVNQIDSKLDFSPDTPRHHKSRHARKEKLTDLRSDELIALLANSYENRRVRQVIEWEHMPRHTFPIAV